MAICIRSCFCSLVNFSFTLPNSCTPMRKRIVSISGFLPNLSTSFASNAHHLVCKSSFACIATKITALILSKLIKWILQRIDFTSAQKKKKWILILFILFSPDRIGPKAYQKNLFGDQLKELYVLVCLKMISKLDLQE